ncbi:hypothetical protein BDV27DRAFT_156797 [Aspergillus caelatus]|uniref:Fungal-type protein kinase domain-containing protein n=1 Tax=Aspergillus caelatus TaxID=61420 RepID=A0A5N7A7V3_9EURO|nr:uncharacterized protein BDV27DRAFT_156797 [Aspergillus caelatus]KAE8365508.1 hypothetical protein BDV27DRAFT_156797 [Aspergillus caelatus]
MSILSPYTAVPELLLRPGSKTGRLRIQGKVLSDDQVIEWKCLAAQIRPTLRLPRASTTIADRATGQKAIKGFEPDCIVQISADDGTCRVPGEFKTPWTTDLSDLDPDDELQVLAQIAGYMNAYSCRFGFVCTYDAVILLKRVGTYRFMVSEPFKAIQPSPGGRNPQVSATEALWWVALQARSNWKWTGPAADPNNLLNGSFILGHNLRNHR